MNLKIALFVVAVSLLTVNTVIGMEIADISSLEDMLPKASANQKVIELYDGSKITIDYDRGVIDYMGVETPIIVDQLQMPIVPPKDALEPELPYDPDYTTKTTVLRDTNGYVHLPYYDDQGNVSLDVYIEDTFYAANQAALDDFWDKFNDRFEILKEETQWSSKRWFGVPLEIYVYGHSAACYGGNASPTHSNVVFSDPMYKTGCHKPYYENGSTYYNNPGELGDWWPYMNTALHEAQHSISPYPIYTRSWLTEGFSEYLMYNVLTITVPGNSIPDINQETADTYLYNGFAGYQWDPYVANDYHDTTVYNRELQRSHGYDITGHMFSKMRDEKGMDWDRFYHLMNNNKESLDRTFSLGPPYIYYTDAFVLNVFGKAMGHTDWLTQTNPVFNYYEGEGADGHGYGARNISHSNSIPPMPYGDFNWFGDLTPTEITFSNEAPELDEMITITAVVENIGDVNLKNITIRIYDDGDLIHEEKQDINKFNSKNITTDYNVTIGGDHVIEVRADEDMIKIELDDTNNDYSEILSVASPNYPPVLEPFDNITRNEMSTVWIRPIATDPNGDELTYYIDSDLFVWYEQYGMFGWKTGPTSSGEYDFTVNVTDGELWDEQPVHLTVLNKCRIFDKRNWCWVECTCPITMQADASAATMLY